MKKIFSDIKSKKANAIFDSIVILVIAFAFVLVNIISYTAFGSMKDGMTTQLGVNDSGVQIVTNSYNKFDVLFDGLTVFVFVGLWIMGIIASFMIDSHPIFFALTAALLLFVIVASIYVANTYDDITSSDALTASASRFVKTNFIMQHLLPITIIIAFTIGFALFAKARS